jgi:hypothetical protein
VKIPQIIRKHRLKLTNERLTDFRQTMKDIVDLKNGRQIQNLMSEPGMVAPYHLSYSINGSTRVKHLALTSQPAGV